MRFRHAEARMSLALCAPACLSACFYHPVGSQSGTDPSSTSTSASTTTGEVSSGTSEPVTGSASSTGSDTGPSGGSTGIGLCGDGNMDPGEACDDGNQTPGDGCDPDCTLPLPACGDGNVDPGEDCDDANDVDTDECINCTLAQCGDSLVWAGMEQCDEGALNGDYGHCAADCSGPGERCGDGVLNGPEDCDDGNDIDTDDCSNECVAPRWIFVTAVRFDGSEIDGLSFADTLCKTAAASLGKPIWRAWLSDGTTAAAARLDDTFTGYYRRTDGMVVAHGWSDLTDGSLQNPISVGEDGNQIMFPFNVWTNTAASGALAGSDHCGDWKSLMAKGRYGLANAGDATWTDAGAADCTNKYRLYCVEN